MKSKKLLKTTASVIGILFFLIIGFALYSHISPLSFGLYSKVNKSILSNEAINGYDPVAYFTQKRPVKGKEEYAYEWNDANWYFASEDNMKMFTKEPEKYAPQFGGYCVFAICKGFTANSDPEAFEIINGKLYLFTDQDLKDEFVKGNIQDIKKAEQNWK
jgi:YHS domain-containing protein